jgi:hypothetical protein
LHRLRRHAHGGINLAGKNLLHAGGVIHGAFDLLHLNAKPLENDRSSQRTGGSV